MSALGSTTADGIGPRLARAAILLLLLARPAAALTLVDLPASLLDSVVRLEGPDICASGFFLTPDTLVTNAHVSRFLCPFGSCQVDRLTTGGPSSQRGVTPPAAELVMEGGGVDVALIQFAEPMHEGQRFGPVGTAEPGDAVHILGWSGCDSLALTSGTLLSRDRLFLSTSARTQPGASGGPVFNDSLELIGITASAGGLVEVLIGEVFDTETSTRAVEAGAAMQVLRDDSYGSILSELRLLNTYHGTTVAESRKLERFWRSLEFLMMADELTARMVHEGFDREATDLATLTGLSSMNALRKLQATEPSDARLEAERLAVAYSIEAYGGRDDLFQPIDGAAILDHLETQGRPADHLASVKELLDDVASPDGPIGFSLTFGLGMLVLMPACAIWAWSLGWVYTSTRGSRVRRAGVMLLVAFGAWPISLGILALMRRHERRVPSPTN